MWESLLVFPMCHVVPQTILYRIWNAFKERKWGPTPKGVHQNRCLGLCRKSQSFPWSGNSGTSFHWGLYSTPFLLRISELAKAFPLTISDTLNTCCPKSWTSGDFGVFFPHLYGWTVQTKENPGYCCPVAKREHVSNLGVYLWNLSGGFRIDVSCPLYTSSELHHMLPSFLHSSLWPHLSPYLPCPVRLDFLHILSTVAI